MTIHLLVLASLLLQGVPTGAPAPPPGTPSPVDAVRARINAIVAEKKVPSMAVAVVHHGKIVWEEGFGWADIENRIPATPRTVYTLASVGKSITATAVMVLAARGALRLDDPVKKHLRPRGRKAGGDRHATIRQLLTMRGGVGHMWRHNWLDEAGPVTSNADVVEAYGGECLPPGTGYHYSNLSYGVLQEVVESVSRKPFAEFVAAEVFGPLGMAGASLRAPRDLGPNDARSYDAGGVKALPYWYSDPLAGAGYRASVHDLALFAMLHLKVPDRPRPEGLTDVAIDELHRPALGFPYGCGWASIDDESGVGTLISNGGIVGSTSMLKLVPSERLAVVCLTNVATEDRITDTIADEIIAAYVPGYRKAMRIPAGVEPVTYTGDAERTGIWKGIVYSADRRVPITLSVGQDGKLALAIDGKAAVDAGSAEIDNGLLVGRFEAMLPGEFTKGEAHRLEMFVSFGRDRMRGYLMAQSTGKRPRFGLPFRVEARRVRR